MDAYEDEMRGYSDLSDSDIEQALDGRENGTAADELADDELAEMLAGLKVACVQPPSPQVASAHLAAIAAEAAPLRLAADAELESANRTHRPARRFRIIRKRIALLPAAALAALLSTAGLAAAGVTMPGAAKAPFSAVGIQLPNQSRSSAVRAVIDATPPSDRGCVFAQSVAATASQGHSAAAGAPCERSQAATHVQAATHSPASGHRNASDTSEATTEETGAGGPPTGVPPTPPAGQQFGQSTAASAQQSASTDGQAFGQSTAQGAQNLTPATPPSGAGSSANAGSETAQGGPAHAPSTPGSPARSTPGGSHTP
jgi:hypothetical protein